jgi:5-methylcytosine-specific restriction endonuclease McrA
VKRQELRRRVFQRDNYRCAYCRWKADRPEERKALTVDHVIPLSKGGTWRMQNLVTSCYRCNIKKGARYTPPRRKRGTADVERSS